MQGGPAKTGRKGDPMTKRIRFTASKAPAAAAAFQALTAAYGQADGRRA